MLKPTLMTIDTRVASGNGGLTKRLFYYVVRYQEKRVTSVTGYRLDDGD
jgi:hypothetical protein